MGIANFLNACDMGAMSSATSMVPRGPDLKQVSVMVALLVVLCNHYSRDILDGNNEHDCC
ncbi:protein of unknown function [Caballeronia sp. S22]